MQPFYTDAFFPEHVFGAARVVVMTNAAGTGVRNEYDFLYAGEQFCHYRFQVFEVLPAI